jgi:cell fate (sporulation/competence/biofilm development) regulator YlbF (YheA/YmcA/DUF963 family)
MMGMAIQKMRETWQPKKNPLRLVEMNIDDKSEVDNVSIIGKVRGDFFVPNGESRNSRYYPKEFWESVLVQETIQQRLKDRLMFGMMGHEDKEIDEKDLESGRVSHIVTSLKIDENDCGIGEALILATEAGKNLLTYLKAGAQLKVSSRASGDYKQGEMHNNMPVMDENSYILETFDFVMDPGFLKAHPALVEKFYGGNEIMANVSEELVAELKGSRDNLIQDLSSARGMIDNLRKENESLKEAIPFSEKDFVKQLSKLEVTPQLMKVAEKACNRTGRTFKSLVEMFASFTKEDVDAIDDLEAPDDDLKELDDYRDLEGTPEDFRRLVRQVEEMVKVLERYGSVENLNRTITEAEKALNGYLRFGSVQEIEETMNLNKAALERYTAMGTIEELQAALTTLAEVQSAKANARAEDAAKRLAKRYHAKLETCRNLVRRLGEEDADQALQDIADDEEEPSKEPLEEPITDDDVETTERFSKRGFLESRMGRLQKANKKNS